ncbi:MAG: hypothetical protein H4O13_09810 [Xanthomonadales bacterium]|nr:hypothetical protein [Xanthomonadales bacterium]
MKAADAVAFERLILAGPNGMRAHAARLAPQIDKRLNDAFPELAARWRAEYLFARDGAGLLDCLFTATDGRESEPMIGEAVALIQLRGLLVAVAELPMTELRQRVQVFQQLLHLSWLTMQGRQLKAVELRVTRCVNQAESKARAAKPRHAEWQRVALEVWADHPRWTKDAVAQEVRDRLGCEEKADTISREISNPNAKPRKPRKARVR